MYDIELTNVNKQYNSGSGVTVKALSNVNLQIKKGEFVMITGPSGSGKSTLLNLIGGLDKANEGIINICGNNLSDMSDDLLADFRSNDIGIVFQNFNLLPMLTTRENIVLPVFLSNKTPDNEYIDDLITKLDLQQKLNAYPNELSGGQQQRVGIGRSLANKPGIVLADEPTGNLDQNTSGEIMKLLKRMNKEFNQTIIMITHNLELTKQVERVIEIVDGKLSSKTNFKI